ncbi:hypothetical protein R1flu_020501 [Riccia fluitans]|uniref:Uncharacterized protein n=1 Tax=Riccia fluitans TaxID=41844 RepID=A0ABD1ZLN5_9MARC
MMMTRFLDTRATILVVAAKIGFPLSSSEDSCPDHESFILAVIWSTRSDIVWELPTLESDCLTARLESHAWTDEKGNRN